MNTMILWVGVTMPAPTAMALCSLGSNGNLVHEKCMPAEELIRTIKVIIACIEGKSRTLVIAVANL